MTRAAVVGLGFGARVHVPALRAAGAEVVALCARNGAGDAAAALGIPNAYDDWRELLAPNELDVLTIATPPSAQPEIAIAALRAGIAVLCEKPLAADVAGAESILEAAAGGQCAVDFEFRAVPAFRRARELGRELGAIEHGDVTWTLPTLAQGTGPPSWKDDPARGGGTVLGFGTHVFDYVEWLLGPIGRVRGTVDERVGGSDTGFSAELELAGPGTVVAVTVDRASSHPTGHAVRLAFEHGELLLANPDLSDYVRGFRVVSPAGSPNADTGPAAEGRIGAVAEICRGLLAGDDVPGPREGLRAQQIAAAVLQSNADWISTQV